eukprot:526997_1
MLNRGFHGLLRNIGTHGKRVNALCLNAQRYKTLLSAIDGTNYGYLALEEAFTMSNPGDNIIGYHIPLDSYQFAYEHLVFQPGIPLSETQQKEYETKKAEFIAEIESKVESVKSKSQKTDVKDGYLVYFQNFLCLL